MKKILSFVAAALLAVPATFAQGGYVVQGDNLMPLECVDSDILEFSGTVEVVPFTPFSFVLDMGMGAMPVGPESDVYLSEDQLAGDGVTGSVSIGDTGEFVVMAQKPTVALEVTFDAFGTSSYSIKLGDSGNVQEPVFVTFNFTGIENGWEALALPAGLTGSTYKYQIVNPGSQIHFQIPGDSLYEIESMKVTNRTAEEIAGKAICEPVNETTWQAAIYYDESFNGMEIDVNIVGKNNVTLNFTGIDNAYEGVGLYNWAYDTEVALSSDSYTLNYAEEGTVSLMANAGYEITIPESADESYNVQYIGQGDNNSVTLNVLPKANGSTIDVNVAKVAVEPTNKVNFTVTGVDDAWKLLTVKQLNPDEPIALTGNTFGFSYKGTSGLNIAVQEGYIIEITSDYTDTEEVYSVSYPGQDGSPYQAVLTLTPGANEINFTITVSEVPVVSVNSVTFSFTGVEDAYKYVNVYDVNGGVVTLAGNSYTFEYGEVGILAFAAKDGYQINIEGPAYFGDIEPYSIQSQDQNGVVSYTVGCFPGADNMVFDVTVTPVTVVTPNYATFSFTGVEDAYEHVNVTEPDGENTIVLSSNLYTYEFDETGFLVISAKEGYSLNIACTTANAEEGVDYAIEGSSSNGTIQYVVAIMTGDLTFNVTVEAVEQLNAVTFNFTGVEDAYKYVTVYEMDGEGYLELNAPTFSYEYAESGALVIAPVEGYMIDVTCTNYTGSADAKPFQIEGTVVEDYTQYVVGVWSAANGLTFEVKVSKDPYSGINSILNGDVESTIYDLNGRKVNANNVGTGIYIINGKKVMIKK